MLPRLLLNADPAGTAAGGNPAPTPAPAPAPPAPEAKAPNPPAANPPAPPPTIPLTVEEYQRLRDTERRLGDMEAQRRQAEAAAEAARLKAMADKGHADKALDEQRAKYEERIAAETARYADLENRYLGEKKANVLGDALAGFKFASPAAARQMREILDGQFAAARDASGTIVVREIATGRPAADAIRDAVATRDYDHFLDPTTRGGAPPANAHHAPPNAPATPANPILEQLRKSMADRAAGAPGLAGTYGQPVNITN